MFATSEGTARYRDRFAAFREAGFYRSVGSLDLTLEVSNLGIGTYLGGEDDDTDRAYTDALIAAGEGGINFFDSAINYRRQRSERCIGAALKQLQRDEVVVCTKAGFLTPGAVPEKLNREEVVGGIHCMAPDFLADQIERSRANLCVDTIDVFYLHNPETQLGFLDRAEFDARIRRAFAQLERLVDQGQIRWYGAATWEGFRKKGALSLDRLAEIAAEEAGPEHHFRFIQLPFNLNMVEAFVERPESVLQAAARLGIAAVASATLLQTQVLTHTDAQHAIQFTRSTPGISVALVGMSRREHVVENLRVASVLPATHKDYFQLYR
jgi:aryl-alcohol dehydrogenase-like predicted oxidoreductase